VPGYSSRGHTASRASSPRNATRRPTWARLPTSIVARGLDRPGAVEEFALDVVHGGLMVRDGVGEGGSLRVHNVLSSSRVPVPRFNVDVIETSMSVRSTSWSASTSPLLMGCSR
jgi:hypothetical protein